MLRRSVLISAFILIFSGCSTGSFLGKRFDNFTAYYNTFYNARKSFDKGYENLHHKNDPVDRDHYLPLFVRPMGNTANREFDSAIRKSADLLRNHPDSRWVDDALLIIGKSYFYQEAFVGALQKFREVIDLKTDLENEARFWLARTLITSGALVDAQTELQESLTRDDVSDDWVALYQLALGELYVRRSEWELTAAALSTGLEDAKDKVISARAWFLLGQIYETMGQYEHSVEAFERVNNYNPLYELSYAARYSAIRVGGYHGDVDRALKDLRKMDRDDKNYGYRSELTFLRARILQAAGDADGAYDIYDRLLYDQTPTANIGSFRSRVHFALGELYRDLDGDYVMASAHFDTAATTLTRPGTAASFIGKEQFTAEAIRDADKLKASFSAFARVFETVSRMDSLLWLGRMSQEEFDAKVLELRRQRAKKLEEQRKLLAARQLEQQFRQGAKIQDPFANRTLPSGKIIPGNNPPTGRNSGFLFHRNSARVQDGQANFLLRWGDRPLVPNWRRLQAISGVTTEQAEIAEDEAVNIEDLSEDELPDVDISGVPRDSLAQARMESDRARARYELGNTLLLAMGRPDSAAVWYRMVIEENGEEPVAQRAFYALAEVQNALGDSLAADRLYRQILEDHPDSDFADRIRVKLGQAREEAALDSTALAEMAYSIVFQKWVRGEKDGLLDEMLSVAASFDGMDVQARALLATGEIHLETSGTDTTALFAALPVELPDSIIGIIWPEKLVIIIADDAALEADSSSVEMTRRGGALRDSSLVKIRDDVDVARDSTLVQTPGEDGAAENSTLEGPLGEDASAHDSPAETETEVRTFETGFSEEAAASESIEMEYRRPTIVIKDLFNKVTKDFAGSPFADRATGVLTALDELRNPSVDTTFFEDSPGVHADSLTLSRDATGGLIPDPPSDMLEVVADTSSVPEEEPALEIIRPVVPGAPVEMDAGDRSGDPIDEGHTVRESGSLKPLLPTGRQGREVLGWTVILEKLPNIGAARVALARLEVMLFEKGIDVVIISGTENGSLEFMIGWGLFPDKKAAYAAVLDAGDRIPRSYEYLLMVAPE